MQYTEPAITDQADLLFGTAPHPLQLKGGLTIGGGRVYPELNFTLPAMSITDANWDEVRAIYRETASDALARADRLHSDGVVLEFETLPDMTRRPEWAIAICEVLLEEIEAARERGLPAALRVTPNDNRDMQRPPRMRSGELLDTTLATFEGCARLGADLLSIESTGGKELHDSALMAADLPQVLFALAVLGVRDMQFLWGKIVAIARSHGSIPAGDTACGFANTAMVLADQSMIPRVFAAVVRAVSAVRSLVAYEAGALGPGKDCGYENPILKAITGLPMAMEGKSAACAHSSPLGNIAAATCDLWSNESVQHLRLLGGWAPSCFLEVLQYDARLLNAALADGPEAALQLRDWLVASDAALDPQAYILAPESVLAIAGAIVSADTHYHAAQAAAHRALELIEEGRARGLVAVPERELRWLELMRAQLDALPEDEAQFITEQSARADAGAWRPQDYDL